MHILHLIKSSEGALWAYELIKEIKERFQGITFSVVIPSGGKHYDKYFLYCENVYDFDFSLNPSVLRQGLRLRSIVRIEQPDIIHSWFTQTTLYARLFLRDFKIPRLFEVVGPLHLESYFYRLFDKFSSQSNDYWKATSHYTYEKYLKLGIPNSKLFLNYIGVDVQHYLDAKDLSPVVNLRTTFNIPNNCKIIGTASYMYPPKLFSKAGVKNHEMLLDVFNEIIKRRNDVFLVIGGSTLGKDKKYEEKLRLKAAKICPDRIIFTGYVENLGRLISEFDVFVFLSLSENLGGVFESLLYEVPTVASDRGGIPELVFNKQTGFTCDLSSINEVVANIESLLEDRQLALTFAKAGKEKVFEVFDKEVSINNSYDIYNKIILVI